MNHISDAEIREAILTRLTVPLWPHAGRAVGRSRNATYDSASAVLGSAAVNGDGEATVDNSDNANRSNNSTYSIASALKDGVAAFVNYCPHAGHPLNFRPHKFLTPDRNLILCCSHGALFERDNGLCIAGPCAGRSLTPVPVEVLNGYVLLAEGVDVERLANAPL